MYQQPMTMYPQQPMNFPQPPQQPQVNAVKIDIINPQAYGGQQNPTMAAPQQQAPQYYYNLPTNPVYNVPQNNYYPAPQQQPQPMPYQAPVMMPQPQPAVQIAPPVMAQPAATAPIQTQIPNTPVAPQMNQTVNQNVEIPAAPIPPAPVAMNTVPATTVQEAAPAAQPVTAPIVDVAGINQSLTSTNLDAQTEAIQKIAELGQNDPVKAAPLLNEETFVALTNIITKDNSSLPGPTPRQIELREKAAKGEALNPQDKTEAETLSQQEKAEMNKQFGTYTLAVLQKNFREAVNTEASKQGIPPIEINELPGIVEVVNNLKDNQNPVIREASISALDYIARPEDKDVLETIYDISAKQDADPDVRKAAQERLAKLQNQ